MAVVTALFGHAKGTIRLDLFVPRSISLLATEEKLEVPNRRNPQLWAEQLQQESEVSRRWREVGLTLGPWP